MYNADNIWYEQFPVIRIGISIWNEMVQPRAIWTIAMLSRDHLETGNLTKIPLILDNPLPDDVIWVFKYLSVIWCNSFRIRVYKEPAPQKSEE